MTATSGDVYGSTRRVVERAASDAAFAIAKSGKDVVMNGKRDAVWRVRPDGVVEVARGEWGRVELYEVHDDAVPRLIAASPRSAAKVASTLCAYGSGAALVIGVLGGMVVGATLGIIAVLSVILFPLSFALRWKSNVRPWIRDRFGSDDGWADVPWEIKGEPTTGSQAIGLTLLAKNTYLRYRVLDDGNLEAVVRVGEDMQILSIDHAGESRITDTLPSKRFKLDQLRGKDVTWHEIVATDPTD